MTRPRLFISYSRSDTAFVDLLIPRLEAAGFDVSIDRSGIRKGEDWWRRIVDLVVDAILVIFVISPESVASPICRQELELARKKALKKRIVPILFRPTTEELPSEVSQRDWVNFEDAGRRYGDVLAAWSARVAATGDLQAFEREDANFNRACKRFGEAAASFVDSQVGQLLTAITLEDLHWHDEAAKWLQRTKAWDDAHCPQGLLLAAGDLERAEEWMQRRPTTAEIPELIGKFIRISHKQAELDRQTLRAITGRAFAVPAEDARLNGNYEGAIRAVAGGALLAKDMEMEVVPALKRTLYLSVPRRRLLKALSGQIMHRNIISPDGDLIVTCHRDAELRISEIRSDRIAFQMKWLYEGKYAPSIETFDVSWPHRLLVASSSQGGIRAWRFGESSPFLDLGGTASMRSLSISNSGLYVLTCGSRGRTVSLLSLANRQLQTIPHEGHPGDAVFAGRDDRAFIRHFPTELWNVSDPSAPSLISALEGSDTSPASPEGDVFCDLLDDGVALRSLHSGEMTARLGQGRYKDALLAKDHVLLVGDRSADLHTLKGEKLRSFELNQARIWAGALRHDGGCVALGVEGGSLALWDTATGSIIHCANDLGDRVNELMFSVDGSILASNGYSEFGSASGLCLWDARLSDYAARIEAATEETSVYSLSRTGDAAAESTTEIRLGGLSQPHITLVGSSSTNFLATSHRSEQLVAWRNNELLWWRAPFTDAPFTSAAERPYGLPIFDAQDQRLAVINDKRVLIFDVATRSPKAVLEGHEKEVRSVAFSEDGVWIATCSKDFTFRVWESDTGQTVATFKSGFEPVRALFGEGRKFLLTTDGQNHHVYSLPEAASVFYGSSNGPRTVVAFNPAGPHFVVPHWDHLGVFRLGEEKPFVTIGREGEQTSGVNFSNDGRTLLTRSRGILRIWDVEAGLEIANTHSSEDLNFLDAHFAPNDDATIVCRLPGELRLWDVRLARALDTSPRVTLAAGLSWNVGYLNGAEKKHLVLQMAPENLERAIGELLSPDETTRAAHLTNELLRQRPTGCYVGASLKI